MHSQILNIIVQTDSFWLNSSRKTCVIIIILCVKLSHCHIISFTKPLKYRFCFDLLRWLPAPPIRDFPNIMRVKPRPHQQHCRSNISCRMLQVEQFFRPCLNKLNMFNLFRLCRNSKGRNFTINSFDIVAFFRNSRHCSRLLLVWTWLPLYTN